MYVHVSTVIQYFKTGQCEIVKKRCEFGGAEYFNRHCVSVGGWVCACMLLNAFLNVCQEGYISCALLQLLLLSRQAELEVRGSSVSTQGFFTLTASFHSRLQLQDHGTTGLH